MIMNKSILKKAVVLLLFVAAIGVSGYAQTGYDVVLEKIDATHQDCLDNTDDMTACATNYYRALDSMMSIVLKAAIKETPNTEKAGLRTEQREWNDSRILKFREIDAAAKQNGDDKSVALEDKAAIIHERIDELLGKLK